MFGTRNFIVFKTRWYSSIYKKVKPFQLINQTETSLRIKLHQNKTGLKEC